VLVSSHYWLKCYMLCGRAHFLGAWLMKILVHVLNSSTEVLIIFDVQTHIFCNLFGHHNCLLYASSESHWNLEFVIGASNQKGWIEVHWKPQDMTNLYYLLLIMTFTWCLLYHLIFYVTRFSIGWKIEVILYHPKKIDLWRIGSNVAEYLSAIEYSAETNHGTCKILLHNIYVFDIIKW
jgi:hypothetical protein